MQSCIHSPRSGKSLNRNRPRASTYRDRHECSKYTEGYAYNSSRGNIIKDLISELNLHLLNEKDSEATYEHRNAKGWPDLTLVKGVQLARKTSWKVRDELSLSGHKYIRTQLGIRVKPKRTPNLKPNTEVTGNSQCISGKKFQKIQQQFLDCNTRKILDATTIFRCCRKAYKLKKSRSLQSHMVNTGD
ncbi:hypothetical protein AVEN_66136-1 [Araneus ventricosus]|uniref:Endonuclease/exonuclease/phosphatase domain-containing protein n=1 Tax=Araneus ventricosus TaxID=182803 RepID=A0A4Y2HI61_ARAVE|nr:hypothetical protein AVEN_66136-1 [Araneus ventricosus]